MINPFVGGAFGSALRTWPHVTLAVLAARRAGRPVRLELTRRQLATSVGFRPRAEQRVALGADREGRLAAVVHEAVAQTSTYEEFADATLDAAASTYACANRRTRYRLVPMHTNTPCPMRGPGHVTGLFAQEVAMDELAVALGIDPVALRLRNYADRHPGKDLPWSSNRLRECFALGAERFGWERRDLAPRAARDGRELVGYGMAAALNPAPRYATSASATLFADGTAVVRSATSDMGPGTYTAATQVAADALGLSVARVRFELGDTAFPAAKEHGGSTTTASIGPAVQAACRALRARLDALARSHQTEAPHDGAGRGAADPAALLRRAGLTRLDADGSAAPGDEAKAYAVYGFGAVFAEVRVDPDLGTARVARVVGAYDAGRVVNPRLAHSQCLGGMVQGIGMALTEDAGWDPRHGRATNATLADYHVPVCASVGALDALFVPGEDPIASPLGTKGLAELGLCGVAPAIANAVWHATGVPRARTADHPRQAADLLTKPTMSQSPQPSSPSNADALGGRLALLDPAALAGAQRDEYDYLTAKQLPRATQAGFTAQLPDGRVVGPFNVFLYAPEIARAYGAWLDAYTAHTPLPDDVSQVIILAVGVAWDATYEVYAHTAVARKAGVSDDVVRAITDGREPESASREARAAWRFANALVRTHGVDDATYAGRGRRVRRGGRGGDRPPDRAVPRHLGAAQRLPSPGAGGLTCRRYLDARPGRRPRRDAFSRPIDTALRIVLHLGATLPVRPTGLSLARHPMSPKTARRRPTTCQPASSHSLDEEVVSTGVSRAAMLGRGAKRRRHRARTGARRGLGGRPSDVDVRPGPAPAGARCACRRPGTGRVRPVPGLSDAGPIPRGGRSTDDGGRARTPDTATPVGAPRRRGGRLRGR